MCLWVTFRILWDSWSTRETGRYKNQGSYLIPGPSVGCLTSKYNVIAVCECSVKVLTVQGRLAGKGHRFMLTNRPVLDAWGLSTSSGWMHGRKCLIPGYSLEARESLSHIQQNTHTTVHLPVRLWTKQSAKCHPSPENMLSVSLHFPQQLFSGVSENLNATTRYLLKEWHYAPSTGCNVSWAFFLHLMPLVLINCVSHGIKSFIYPLLYHNTCLSLWVYKN